MLSLMDGGSALALPFELAVRADGTWRSRWREQELFIVVGGTDDAPLAALLATLRDVVVHWPEYQQRITTFARALAGDEHVPLEPREIGGFAARSCGFDQKLSFDSIAVTDGNAPHRVRVTFYTGYPDGYATYAVVLEHGAPTSISAFAA
jgi:hypothetical protein